MHIISVGTETIVDKEKLEKYIRYASSLMIVAAVLLCTFKPGEQYAFIIEIIAIVLALIFTVVSGILAIKNGTFKGSAAKSAIGVYIATFIIIVFIVIMILDTYFQF